MKSALEHLVHLRMILMTSLLEVDGCSKCQAKHGGLNFDDFELLKNQKGYRKWIQKSIEQGESVCLQQPLRQVLFSLDVVKKT